MLDVQKARVLSTKRFMSSVYSFENIGVVYMYVYKQIEDIHNSGINICDQLTSKCPYQDTNQGPTAL